MAMKWSEKGNNGEEGLDILKSSKLWCREAICFIGRQYRVLQQHQGIAKEKRKQALEREKFQAKNISCLK